MSPTPLFLMGPTATGKTALSIALAKELNGEVISVDSVLVYRGMDIGTAKPTMDEREGFAHHLIDICDPADPYSAAQFCSDAKNLVEEICDRGKTPILTGGTMLYFHALEKGLSPLPAADEAIRAAIAAEAEEQGWDAMHSQLANIDPESAQRIHPNDPQRLQRAIEVYRISGKTLTQLQAQVGPKLEGPLRKIALQPQNRAWLHQRIEKRFDLMLDAGFLDEVRQFHADGLDPSLPAMRSVGYRQAFEFLDGTSTKEAFREKAIAATRQLAKRQITWLRGMDGVYSISCDSLELEQQVQLTMKALENQ